MMENFDALVTDRAVQLAGVEAFLESGDEGLFRNRYVALATSGSTGCRGVFLFNPNEWLTALAYIARPMAWAGLKPNFLRPARTAMLASTTPWHYSARVGRSLSSRFVPSLRLDATEPLDSMVRRLNEWQPEILAIYPSILRRLAEEQIAGRLHIRLRHIATSAEVLTSETRRRVTEAWGIAVNDTYGATEYAPIAAECAFGRKHLLEDGAMIEIADARGPVAAGEMGNRVLLTIFGRYTQPLIRYEISDMVRSIEGECECGRPFRLIDRIEGRQEDVVYLPSQRGGAVAMHPNVFHRVMETVPAAGWQVVQDGDALHVYLIGLRDGPARDRIRKSVYDELTKEGAVPPRIMVESAEELRRGSTGKAPLVLANTKREPAGSVAV